MSTAAKAEISEAPAEAIAKPKTRFLPLILAMVVAAAASAGGVYFFAMPTAATHAATPEAEGQAAATSSAHGDGHAEAKPAAKSGTAIYVPLAPAFIVNLADTEATRYLMVEMDVMGRQGPVETLVTEHLPRIRSALLMLMSQRTSASLQTRKDKEALQQAVLAEIQSVLTQETGKPVVDAVYFTSFVVQ